MAKIKFDKDDPRAFQNLSKERMKEIATMGSIAGHKAKKEKKSMREILQWLLEQKPTDEEIKAAQKILPDVDTTVLNKNIIMLLRQIHKAISLGDTKAATFVRDTSGEKPVDVLETTGGERIVYVTPAMNKATQDHIDKMIEQSK